MATRRPWQLSTLTCTCTCYSGIRKSLHPGGVSSKLCQCWGRGCGRLNTRDTYIWCSPWLQVGFDTNAAKFFWYLLFMCLTLFTFTFYGIMTVAVTPALPFAAIIFGVLIGFWNLFSGFIIPKPVHTVFPLFFVPCFPGSWCLQPMRHTESIFLECTRLGVVLYALGQYAFCASMA